MRSRQTAGFTLLEIMLVMVLLGLVAGFVVPTLSPKSDDDAKFEAERFYQLIQLWTEEALLSGQTFGVRVDDKNHYQLLKLGDEDWETVTLDRRTTEVTMPEGVELALDVSGFESKEDQLFSRESLFKDEKLFTSGIGLNEEEEKIEPPQVVLMGNGEVIAFTLTFSTEEKEDKGWMITANDVATFELKTLNEGKE